MSHAYTCSSSEPPDNAPRGSVTYNNVDVTQLRERQLSDSDKALVSGVRVHDERVFEQLFHRYYQMLVRYSESFIGSRDDAEEVVSMLFAHIWSNASEFDPQGGLRPYLFLAVRNRTFNLLRSSKRDAKRYRAMLLEESEYIGAAEAEPVEMVVEQQDISGRIEALISILMNQLTPRVREVVSLRWQHGMSFEEIASVTDVTPSAVRLQWSRAMKLFREHLPDYLV